MSWGQSCPLSLSRKYIYLAKGNKSETFCSADSSYADSYNACFRYPYSHYADSYYAGLLYWDPLL